MHIFKKSSKLDNVLYDVRGPVVEEAARMEERGTHVLKLNIGNPAPFGFRTPDEVIYDMSQQLSDCEGYSPSQGLFSARKAIMQYSQIKKLPNVTINDIYTGNGVSELIPQCFRAYFSNSDIINYRNCYRSLSFVAIVFTAGRQPGISYSRPTAGSGRELRAADCRRNGV